MLQRMRQIGLRTAELHLALASGVGKSAFAPEPIAAADTAAWADRLLARLRGVTDTLRHRRRHEDLSEAAQHSVQQWLDRHDTVAEHIESVRKVRFDGLKTRVHGDFDLGQVLIVKDDAVIFDFEGDPRLPLQERRSKMPPAWDVATFMASMDNAVNAAIERAANLTPADRAALTARTRAWSKILTAAFWDSYRETLAGSKLWPTNDAQTRTLLDIFRLTQAFDDVEMKLRSPASTHAAIEQALQLLRRDNVLL